MHPPTEQTAHNSSQSDPEIPHMPASIKNSSLEPRERRRKKSLTLHPISSCIDDLYDFWGAGEKTQSGADVDDNLWCGYFLGGEEGRSLEVLRQGIGFF